MYKYPYMIKCKGREVKGLYEADRGLKTGMIIHLINEEKIGFSKRLSYVIMSEAESW